MHGKPTPRAEGVYAAVSVAGYVAFVVSVYAWTEAHRGWVWANTAIAAVGAPVFVALVVMVWRGEDE